jgi:hypothetical protein
VRHDHRNLLRGRPDGAGGILPTAAGITGIISITRRFAASLSFSTGKTRSSAVSLPVAQTLAIAEHRHVRLRGS